MPRKQEPENRLLFVNATESGDPCMDGEMMEFVRGLGWIRGLVVSVEAKDDWELRGIADEIEQGFESRGWSVRISRDPIVTTTA